MQEVRKSCSVAIGHIVADRVHNHIVNTVGDWIMHVRRLFEVSEVPTHDSNLRFNEDLPVREFPQEHLVLFRLLYVAKEPGRVLCFRAMFSDFD